MILVETETDRAAKVIDELEDGDGDDRFGSEFMADLFRRAEAANVHPARRAFLDHPLNQEQENEAPSCR